MSSHGASSFDTPPSGTYEAASPTTRSTLATVNTGRLTSLLRPHNLVILLGALALFMGYTALPFYCPLIILVFPPCLFWLALTSPSGAQAFKRGWYLGLWGLSASLYWLTVPMTTVGQMPLIMAIPCVMLLGSFLALYTGLAVFCFRGLLLFFNGVSPNPKVFPLSLIARFRQNNPAPSCQNADIREQQTAITSTTTKNDGDTQPAPPRGQSERLALPSNPFKTFCLFFMVGLCYGGVELATAHIFTGFPWLSLPIALAEIPFLIQPVGIFGAYGYSAALVFITLCPFVYFLRPRPERTSSASVTIAPMTRSVPLNETTQAPEKITNDNAENSPKNSADSFTETITASTTDGPYSSAGNNIGNSTGPIATRDTTTAVTSSFGGSIPRAKSYSAFWYILSPVLVIALLVCSAGVYSYTTFNQRLSTKSIRVGIAQSNIDQNQKWLPPMQNATVQKHFALSRKAISESTSPLNLLLWSETAMPFFYQSDEPYRSQLNDFARQNNVSIAFGTMGYIYIDARQSRQFNRLQLVSPEGLPHGHYDKEHLVPFGEYNPIPFPLPFLDKILQGVNFSAGRNQPLLALPQNAHIDALLSTWPTNDSNASSTADNSASPAVPSLDLPTQKSAPNGSSPHDASPQSSALTALKNPDGLALTPQEKSPLALLGSLICYEVIFPHMAQERVAQGAHILLTISNDSWFGKTAAPQQHLNHAVLRAVEQRRSVIRSTSSGYSALILPNGEVLHRSALYEEDAYSFTAPLSRSTTIYHIFYQVIDGLLLLGLCIAVVLGVQFRRCGSHFR